MKQEEEILENINEAVERYNNLPLFDTKEQSDILRILTSNLFYLTKYRIEASERWHSVYFQSQGKTNAAKEREADMKVQDLYMYRQIITSANKVVDAVRSTISIYKNENN